MKRHGYTILLSATDLMRFMGCTHATRLDLDYLNKVEGLTPNAVSEDEGHWGRGLGFLSQLHTTFVRSLHQDRPQALFELALRVVRMALVRLCFFPPPDEFFCHLASVR